MIAMAQRKRAVSKHHDQRYSHSCTSVPTCLKVDQQCQKRHDMSMQRAAAYQLAWGSTAITEERWAELK